ncbi:unnamed protein product [Cunninghamella blakesleeana]
MAQLSSANLVDNKFLLGTTVLHFASWVIAFGGLCGIGGHRYLGASWWIIIFELLLYLGIVYLILTDLLHQYRLVVLAFLAVSISYITEELAKAIGLTYDYYRSSGGAIAAGYIIIIIIQFAWIFAFGSDPQSYIGELVKTNHNSVQQQPPTQQQQQQQQAFQQQPIELTSDKTAYEMSNSPTTTNNNNNNTINTNISNNNNSHQGSPALSHPSAVNSPVLEYKERVEALHDYTASPDDPNELSFERGEVLEIVDRRGNWWQARKSDGTVGIIPSNYFAA